jgi:hypothetical protein
MVKMKKANLKAKRLIHYTQYTSKGKQLLSKWEDINPNEVTQDLNY